MLWLSRLVVLSSCLLTSHLALADEPSYKITSCQDPATGSHYFSNVETGTPPSCQNIKIIDIPQYKSTPSASPGLRETEKTQLKAMEEDQEQKQKESVNTQSYDQIGSSLYGAWLDKRQDMCFAYRARVEEAQADRKDDVKLNRQIQRDLTQIGYYCR